MVEARQVNSDHDTVTQFALLLAALWEVYRS